MRLVASALVCGLTMGWPVVLAASLTLLDCAEVNLLGPSCGERLDEEQALQPPEPEPPLFTLQTMRPDTPPLLLKVFNEPTPENMQAYRAWEARYLNRVFEVEALMKAYPQEGVRR